MFETEIVMTEHILLVLLVGHCKMREEGLQDSVYDFQSLSLLQTYGILVLPFPHLAIVYHLFRINLLLKECKLKSYFLS